MANSIILKGQPIRKEGVAGVAMKPGHVVVSNPREAGKAGTLGFAAALGDVALGVVLENELEGKEMTVGYALNDNVLYGVFPPGAEVYLRLPAAAPAVAIGKALCAKTDGTVALATIGTHHPIATAIEAVDNSAGGTEVFIKCEIC